MTGQEPWRWQHADGRPGYTPADYFKLGQLSTVADRLYDLVGPGSGGGGDYDGLDATPAELAAVDQVLAEVEQEEGAMYDDEDELAAMLAELDEAEGGFPPYEDTAGNDYGLSNTYDMTGGQPITAAIEAARRAGMDRVAFARYARTLARGIYRQSGSIYDLCAGYAEPGMLEGHPIELANAPGPDSGYELSRQLGGEYGRACGPPDHFGRCASRYHAPGCIANTAQAAAVGSAEEVGAWNGTAARSAGLALRDQLLPYGTAG